jgi:hypothetical protein
MLGLCAMVFGILAFNATAAQAAKQWLFAEKEPKSGLIAFLEAEVELEKDKGIILVLHTEISKTKVLFLCTTISASGIKLTAGGNTNTGGIIIFSGCKTDLGGSPSAPCVPKNKGTEEGVIVTKPLHSSLVTHELAGGVKDDLLSVLPDTGETFVTMEMGSECAIGQKVPVIGKMTFKDCEGLALSHLVKHLLEIGPLTELWTISKHKEHVATILGSFWAFLKGAHAGIKFSGDPV